MERHMTNKQLGLVKKFDLDRQFGFITDAEHDFQGRVVPARYGRTNDHFFTAAFLRQSKIAPEDVREGLVVTFNPVPSRKYEGRTIARDIEIVDEAA
jgi:hypothetical protein